jgi:hypothetical protein
MPNKRKRCGRPHNKTKYSNQKTRSEANKIRKMKKYKKEREKRKGTCSKESRTETCTCGKKVQVHRYKCKDKYTCTECRVKKEPNKFKK